MKSFMRKLKRVSLLYATLTRGLRHIIFHPSLLKTINATENIMSKNTFLFTKFFGLAFLTLSTTHALALNLICPPLSADNVKALIAEGSIATDPTHTLAVESGKTPEQVVRDEPTANPYDTFYRMLSVKYVNSAPYVVYVGNILGKDNEEARNRAGKILPGDEKNFTGSVYDKTACVYKVIDASPSINSYPFKSKYETVSLLAFDATSMPEEMWKTLPVIK